MPHSVASYLGLHCLLRPVGLNTYSKVKHGESNAQTVSQKDKIITKSLLITNRLSIRLAGRTINYLFSPDKPALAIRYTLQ